MTRDKNSHTDARRARLQLRLFLCTNFLYLWLVHGWALWLYPIGPDYFSLADPGALPLITARVLNLQLHVFGDWIPGYHAFNFMLLYGAMVAVLMLTRFVTDGPWWIGSLAAVLMMSNPAKSAAVLPLSAVEHLLPPVIALAALAAYAGHVRHGRWWAYVLALALHAVASLSFVENLLLFGVVVAADIAVGRRPEYRLRRLAPFAFVFAAALMRHHWVYLENAWDPVAAFAPLYLAFYPLGLLPSTAMWFEAYPLLWLGWLVFFAGVVWGVYRVAPEPGILFGVAGAFVFRGLPAGGFDFMHLWGASDLVVPIALLSIAHASVWMRVQRHPKWRHLTITTTTLICLMFFGLQYREIGVWKRAGVETREFQAQVAQAREHFPRESLAVMPELMYWSTAPFLPAKSVMMDTPFSEAHELQGYFPMHRGLRPDVEFEVLDWSILAGRVRVTGMTSAEMFGAVWAEAERGEVLELGSHLLEIESAAEREYTFNVLPTGGFLPRLIVPYMNRGEGLALPPTESEGAPVATAP